MQFRTIAFVKQTVEIVADEEVGTMYTELEAETIAKIFEVKIIVIFLHLFVTINLIRLLRVAAQAITDIRAETDAECTLVPVVPVMEVIVVAPGIEYGDERNIDIADRKLTLFEI